MTGESSINATVCDLIANVATRTPHAAGLDALTDVLESMWERGLVTQEDRFHRAKGRIAYRHSELVAERFPAEA